MTQDPQVYLLDPDNDDRACVGRQLDEVNLEFRSYSDAEAFLATIEPSRLGCVLTELKVGGSTAFHLIKRLRQRSCSMPVVLLTSQATVPLVVQAFKAGLFDLLQKPSEAFQLWECATRAFEAHRQEMQEAHHRNGIKNRISDLSRQELHVMQMLLDGEPNKGIARRLGLSQRTIVFRRKSLMQKMQAKSVAELACLVQAVTKENGRDSGAPTASLLDVHVAASMCDTAGKFNSQNGIDACGNPPVPRSAARSGR
jgi:two-component system response regulator FixJ